MQAQAERIGPATLSRYAEVVNTGLTEMRGATAPRLLLELLCARMLLPAAVPVDPAAESAVLQRLEQLERRVTAAPGQPAQAPAAPQRAAAPQPAPAPAPQQVPQQAPQQVSQQVSQQAEPPRGRPEFTRRSSEQPAAPEPPAPEPVRQVVAPPPATSTPAGPPAPEPQAPEPMPAAAGAMDAAAVRRVWPEIERYVRENSKPTLVLLQNATVQSVEGTTLVLSMPTEGLARQLSGETRVRVLREALMHAVGGEWTVQCVAGGRTAAPAPPPAATPARPAPTRPSQRQAPEAARPVEQPPPPEPPDDPHEDDIPPPPEPEDEEELLAQAAREPAGGNGPVRDPEKEMLELLANQLGAKPLDNK